MPFHCFQIDDALRLCSCPPETAVDADRRADARVWLDLYSCEPAELEDWLDRLGVRGLARQLCLGARDRPGFYPFREEILLVVALLAAEGSHEVDYLACLCRKNLLLTVHGRPVDFIQRRRTLEDSDTWLPEGSIAGLVSSLMMGISLESLRRTVVLRSAIVALDERMDRAPDTVEAEEIIDQRSELLASHAVVSDQLPAMKSLSETDKPFLKFGDAREYMHCAVTNLQAADVSLHSLGQRLDSLRSALQMHAQDKTNRRLGMLTALSAIFMPITLLAGIWGMNFEAMPELKLPFGYPLALGLMLLVGGGMYGFFRRTGWFD